MHLENKRLERIGETRKNNQGSYMKIINYKNANDVDIEFLDNFHYVIHGVRYRTFDAGNIKNPYYPSVFGVGMIGAKYPSAQNNKQTKEYKAWKSVLKRCFDTKTKEMQPTYKNVTCCDEWLLYENFYEWLHSQENFDKWLNGEKWAIDKDILVKGNKVYSLETCCLVPSNVNSLFLKNDADRGILPIGVCKDIKSGLYISSCRNPITRKSEWLGKYDTPLKSFNVYKFRKESIIKQVAEIEYRKNNITQQCYNAMMDYEVTIND